MDPGILKSSASQTPLNAGLRRLAIRGYRRAPGADVRRPQKARLWRAPTSAARTQCLHAYMVEEPDTSPLPSAGPMNADTCVSMRSGTRLYVDPMVRAAECDHAIERVADPERRVVLESLRSF